MFRPTLVLLALTLGWSMPTLAAGPSSSASGGSVQTVQQTLQGLGLYRGALDGIYGPQTLAAVSAFQREHGLTASGRIGPHTALWLSLYEQPQPVLSEGSSGSSVIELQGLLQLLGEYSGALDGIYGPETAQAVASLQRQYALTPDGICGPLTWQVVRAPRVTVQPGDTLGAIAQALNIGVQALAAYNHLTNPNELLVGQVLLSPPASTQSAVVASAASETGAGTLGSPSNSSTGVKSTASRPASTATGSGSSTSSVPQAGQTISPSALSSSSAGVKIGLLLGSVAPHQSLQPLIRVLAGRSASIAVGPQSSSAELRLIINAGDEPVALLHAGHGKAGLDALNATLAQIGASNVKEVLFQGQPDAADLKAVLSDGAAVISGLDWLTAHGSTRLNQQALADASNGQLVALLDPTKARLSELVGDLGRAQISFATISDLILRAGP